MSDFSKMLDLLKENPERSIKTSNEQLKKLDEVFVTLSSKWPKGLTRYLTIETLTMMDALLGVTIAVRSKIIENLGTLSPIFNLEQLERIASQLDRAFDRVKPSFNLLVKNKREKKEITELDPQFREDMIKWVIEINSALFVIPQLEANQPGLFLTIMAGIFVITGLALAAFFEEGFTVMINGAIVLAKLLLRGARAAAKALLPDWLLPVVGITLGGIVVYKVTKD